MQSLVCLAGFPLEVVAEINNRPAKRFTGDAGNKPIIRAIREPYEFRGGMEEFFLNELVKRIESFRTLEEVSIVLVYAAYGGAGMQAFLERFFPFALAASVEPFYPSQSPKPQRRNLLMGHVDLIERTVEQCHARARIVRDVLSGQPLSPLLLPLTNFRSDVLRPEVSRLYEEVGVVDDIRQHLGEAGERIVARHPLQRLKSGKRSPYFEDDRSLRFKSPGSDRHGMARNQAEGHPARCLINARVRLGGPFDALLHYDCDYERGSVDRQYVNCHGADAAPAVRTHVNIAPSDAIR